MTGDNINSVVEQVTNRLTGTAVPEISTGEPSTLGTYLKIARLFGPRAEEFIQRKINESPNGTDEVVIGHESQVLILFAHLTRRMPTDEELGKVTGDEQKEKEA